MSVDQLPARLRPSSGWLGIAQHLYNCFSKGLRVIGRYKHARALMLNHLWNASDGGRYHRFTHRQGLDDGLGHTIGFDRRHDDHIHGRQTGWDVLAQTSHMHLSL
jgi:hypothetical protein